ncbi:MAG: 16S rRNA (adenine(1518)-N(6)/adenine(1519)-N(6))-dimethyltransferase RsmA [Oscillospiraceae bacterium]
MSKLSNISVIKDVLTRHGFTFSKALGQNFLVNPSVCPRMAELGGAGAGVGVIEIGPGIGVLSEELALRADKVVCIEIDKRLMPILDETLSEHNNIKIINNDVLDVDLHQLIKDEFEGMDVVVCANLPYYITSPIIMHLLESKLPIKRITVMVQKEAAQRICALPATRDIGAITVAIRYYSEPHLLFNVSRGSFMPSPDVDSAVIALDILDKPSVDVKDEATFFKVVKGGFSQRRKTLINCLSGFFSISKSNIGDMLESLDIKSTARAEELTMQQFGLIADKIFDYYSAEN